MSDESEGAALEVMTRERPTRSKPAWDLHSTARGDRSRFPTRVKVRVRHVAMALPRAVWSLPRQRRGSRS